MHVRDEETVAFAAGAEAAITGGLRGKLQAGNFHLINGLFDCKRNHVPVLAIAAHIPSSEVGLGAGKCGGEGVTRERAAKIQN